MRRRDFIKAIIGSAASGGVEYGFTPNMNGIKQIPIEGVSMAYALSIFQLGNSPQPFDSQQRI
jgi:hypothetical protein